MNKKIAIIGNAGSGKTTLAFLLQEKLKLPLYHLDQYYWKPGWRRREFEQFATTHNELCELDEWIIEGSYMWLAYHRMHYADVIIFLDVPRYKCIWRVIKRAIIHHGKIIPGSPEGCHQRLLSFEFLVFLKWVWNYDRRNRVAMMYDLETFRDEKKIYVLGAATDIAKFYDFFA